MTEPTIEEARTALEAARKADEDLYSLLSRCLSLSFIRHAQHQASLDEIEELKAKIAELKEQIKPLELRAQIAEGSATEVKRHSDDCHAFLMRRGGLNGEDMSVQYAGKTLLERLKILLGEKP